MNLAAASLLTASTRAELEETADFVTKFAHQAIDEGADIFVGHGSHFPMGIEIYKGKPIFYSVGNFVFQNETVGFFPADAYERFDLDLKATPSDFLDARTNGGKKGHPSDPAYWENMFAVCEFNKQKLTASKSTPSTKASADQDRNAAGRARRRRSGQSRDRTSRAPLAALWDEGGES